MSCLMKPEFVKVLDGNFILIHLLVKYVNGYSPFNPHYEGKDNELQENAVCYMGSQCRN